MTLFLTLMIAGTVGMLAAASMTLTDWTPGRDAVAMVSVAVAVSCLLAGTVWGILWMH